MACSVAPSPLVFRFCQREFDHALGLVGSSFLNEGRNQQHPQRPAFGAAGRCGAIDQLFGRGQVSLVGQQVHPIHDGATVHGRVGSDAGPGGVGFLGTPARFLANAEQVRGPVGVRFLGQNGR